MGELSVDKLSLLHMLLLAGALLLLVLLVQGWWTARRADPRRAEGERQCELERQEPRLESHAPAGAPSVMDSVLDALSAGDAAQHAVAHADTQPMVVHKPRTARRAAARLDALIDVIATLHPEAPVSGEAALAHLPPTRRVGTKPWALEGLNMLNGEWETPLAGERYGEFQAGLQLANRSGAVSEIEYSEWVHKVQAFADAVGAMADFPDMREAVARARELDQFASQHDAQLSLNLRAKGAAWTVGYLVQTAGKLGMVPGGLPGRLVLPGPEDGEPPLLALQFDAKAALAEEHEGLALREAQLVFDVPQTDESQEPYGALQDLARRLARELEAEIVDGDRQPLGPHGFAAIHTELNRLYKLLASRDLAAGSVAARRLFS